jgi:hypothetical protein
MQYNEQLEDNPKLAKLNFLLMFFTTFIILIVGFFSPFRLIISCSFWANIKRIRPIALCWGLTKTRVFSVSLLTYTKTNICNRILSEKVKFMNYHIPKILRITINLKLSSTSQLMALSQ